MNNPGNMPPRAAQNSQRTTIIIVVVVVLLLCCCCLSLGLLWQFGDAILAAMGMASLPPAVGQLLG